VADHALFFVGMVCRQRCLFVTGLTSFLNVDTIATVIQLLIKAQVFPIGRDIWAEFFTCSQE